MMMGSSIALLMVVSGQRFALSTNRGNVETHAMDFQITLATRKQTHSIKELRNIRVTVSRPKWRKNRRLIEGCPSVLGHFRKKTE